MTTAQNIMAAEGVRGIYCNAPLALNAASATTNTGASSIAPTLTTTVPNTIIVALIMSETAGTVYNPVTTVTDTHGLTWYFRGFAFISGNLSVTGFLAAEIWWAAAPVAQAYTLTINLNGATNGTAVHLFAVSGVLDELTPFDVNASLPAKGSYEVASTPTTAPVTASFSTTGSNKLFLFAGAVNTSTVTMGVAAINGVTATLLESSSMAGGSTNKAFSEFSIQTGPVSSGTAAETGSTSNWAIIADALLGTSATTGSSTVTTSGSLTVAPYNTYTIEVWGPGGGGAGVTTPIAIVNGGAGTATTCFGLSAGGGGGGSSTGGAGGTASGGTTNTSGTAGAAGALGSSAGAGGAGANGGPGGAAVAGVPAPGNAGTGPGGGGGGASNTTPSSEWGGGGGGGAYSKIVYTKGQAGAPVIGSTLSWVIGTIGAGGVTSENGGNGANGQAKFTWT